jgi:hypothetical protein
MSSASAMGSRAASLVGQQPLVEVGGQQRDERDRVGAEDERRDRLRKAQREGAHDEDADDHDHGRPPVDRADTAVLVFGPAGGDAIRHEAPRAAEGGQDDGEQVDRERVEHGRESTGRRAGRVSPLWRA